MIKYRFVFYDDFAKGPEMLEAEAPTCYEAAVNAATKATVNKFRGNHMKIDAALFQDRDYLPEVAQSHEICDIYIEQVPLTTCRLLDTAIMAIYHGEIKDSKYVIPAQRWHSLQEGVKRMPAWIKDIQKRLNEATPAPWTHDRSNVQKDGSTLFVTYMGRWKDAELVAHAPEDIAKLIAAVEAAEKSLGWIKEWMMEQEHDLSIWDREIYDKVLEALAQLQSGEFPVTSNE